jgi:hypothetical protein
MGTVAAHFDFAVYAINKVLCRKLKGLQAHGQGTFTNVEGNHYEGIFEDEDLFEGSVRYPNGSTYKGQLKDFKAHGQGTLTDADGNQLKGVFKNDKLHVGRILYPDSSRYPGQLEDLEPHGQGILTDAASNQFIGVFENGKHPLNKYGAYDQGNKTVGNDEGLGEENGLNRKLRHDKSIFQCTIL